MVRTETLTLPLACGSLGAVEMLLVDLGTLIVADNLTNESNVVLGVQAGRPVWVAAEKIGDLVGRAVVLAWSRRGRGLEPVVELISSQADELVELVNDLLVAFDHDYGSGATLSGAW